MQQSNEMVYDPSLNEMISAMMFSTPEGSRRPPDILYSGMTRDEEKASGYSSWRSMVRGCKPDKTYGKRGIRCDDRWAESFDAFIEDMGPKPDSRAYLRRYDYEKDYCPENCYWEPWASVVDRKGYSEIIDTPTGRMSVLQFAESIDRAVGTVLGLLRKEYTPEQIISGEADEEEKAKRKAAKQELI